MGILLKEDLFKCFDCQITKNKIEMEELLKHKMDTLYFICNLKLFKN